jgi:hypothetical protein
MVRREGMFEKVKCVGNHYNIKTIFKTGHTLMSMLMRSRAKGDARQTAHCICSISCECGINCISEVSRPLILHIQEQRPNLKDSFLEKLKLAQHAFEEDQAGWSKFKILQIERNRRYRKYKETAHMVCLTDSISQPSLEISPICIPQRV